MYKKVLLLFILFSISILGNFDPAKEFSKIRSNISKYPTTSEKLKSQIEPYSEVLSQSWNSGIGWENNHLYVKSYDETNHELTNYQYVPDSVLIWKYRQKTIDNYNVVQGFLLPSLSTTYKYSDTGWVKMAVVDYTFDTDFRMVQSRMYLISGGTMMLFGQADLTYNSINNVLLEVVKMLNFQTLMLEYSSKTEYNYNPNDPNDLTSIIKYKYENESWVGEQKNTYTRNAAYQILTELEELYVTTDSLQMSRYQVSQYFGDTILVSLDITNYDEETGQYSSRSKNVYTYNMNYKCVSDLSQEYIEEYDVWVDTYRTNYSYDSQNRMTHELSESNLLGVWSNVFQIIYYYTPTTVEDEIINVNNYSLSNNYPNPFNPSTTIKFNIPTEGFVTLKVYDMLGREVVTLVNENKSVGEYSYNFNAAHLASGMYIYQLKVNNYVSSKKMLLIK